MRLSSSLATDSSHREMAFTQVRAISFLLTASCGRRFKTVGALHADTPLGCADPCSCTLLGRLEHLEDERIIWPLPSTFSGGAIPPLKYGSEPIFLWKMGAS